LEESMEERGRSTYRYMNEAGQDLKFEQIRGNLEEFGSVHKTEAGDNSLVEHVRGNLEEFGSWWLRRPVT